MILVNQISKQKVKSCLIEYFEVLKDTMKPNTLDFSRKMGS